MDPFGPFGTAGGSVPRPESPASSQQAYDRIYREFDPTGSGAVPGNVFAQNLARTQLPNNVLSQIWSLAHTSGQGTFSKDDVYLALKLAALAQNGQEVRIENVSLPNIPAPRMTPVTIGGASADVVGEAGSMGGLPRAGTPTGPATPGAWAIGPEEKAADDQHFASLQPVGGFISGKLARDFLMRSGLPVATLGQIWQLADHGRDGKLDSEEFAVAMHLVNMALKGQPLPTTLPENLVPPSQRGRAGHTPVPGAAAPVSPQSIRGGASTPVSGGGGAPWVVTGAAKAGYDKYFAQCDTDGDGLVSGQDVMPLFNQSGLPQHTLAQIWNLVDLNHNGQLDAEQFALAMHMIARARAGTPVPPVLPPDHVPPSRRKPASGISSPVLARAGTATPTQRSGSAIPPVPSALGVASVASLSAAGVGMVGMRAASPAMDAQLGSLDSRLSQLEEKKTATEADVAARQASLHSVNEQIQQRRAEIERLEQTIAEQEVLLSDAQRKKAVSDTQLSQVTARVEELTAQHDAAAAQLQSMNEQIAGIEQRMAAAQQEYADVYHRAQEREEEVGTMRAHVAEREQELGAYENAIQQYSQRLTQLDDEVERLAAQIIEVEESIDSKTSEHASLDAQVKTKEEEKAHSQANVQEKQQRLTVLTEAVAGLQAQLRSLDSEIAANHAKAEQLDAQARALEAEKATHSNTMESKKSIAGTAAAAAAVAAAAAAATAVGVHHARAADAETSVAPAIEVRKASEASAVHEAGAIDEGFAEPSPAAAAADDDWLASASSGPTASEPASDPFASFPATDPFAAPASGGDSLKDPFSVGNSVAASDSDPFAAADDFAAPRIDPADDPFANATEEIADLDPDPFGAADADGAAEHDPFAQTEHDVFDEPGDEDPFGAPAADFGAPASDPFGSGAPADDPFASHFPDAATVETAAAHDDDPFAAFPGASHSRTSSAAAPAGGDVFGGSDPFASDAPPAEATRQPEPLATLTSEDQMRAAIEASMHEMTAEEREEAELRAAIEASLREQ